MDREEAKSHYDAFTRYLQSKEVPLLHPSESPSPALSAKRRTNLRTLGLMQHDDFCHMSTGTLHPKAQA